MSIAELMQTVQFVVDQQGQQTAVQMDIATWNALQRLIEDLEDMAEIAQAQQEQEETFAWETVLAEYQTLHGLKADVSP
ncbi:MAG: hypothetical protein IPL28_24750 [Chloroflexi bacterium]|nr:hypothetical protein [Chloroflexota bacterium]